MRALRPDEIDADTDGFSAALDCDDSNPTIRPGALEIPGNAVDENCDQRREPFPKLTTNATISAFFGKKFSLMERLRITGLEGGETVKISCKGRGCRKSIRGSVRVRAQGRRPQARQARPRRAAAQGRAPGGAHLQAGVRDQGHPLHHQARRHREAHGAVPGARCPAPARC